MRAFGVRLPGSRQAMTVSTDSAAAVTRSGTRREIGQRHNVTIRVDEETGEVTAEGDPTAVDAALQDLALATSGPTIEITLPKDRTKRLMWTEGKDAELKHIDRLRQLPGMLSCQLNFPNASLTLTAKDDDTAAAAISLVDDLMSGAEGVVTLSNAAFISSVKGRQAATLNELRVESGCTEVRGPQRDSSSLDFRIKAPNKQNIESFHARVLMIDPNAQLKITGEWSVLAVDKATGKPWLAGFSSSSLTTSPKSTSEPPSPREPKIPTKRTRTRTVSKPAPAPAPKPENVRRNVTVEADTVEEATSIGLKKLGTTRRAVFVEILVEPEYTRIRKTVKRQAKVRLTTR